MRAVLTKAASDSSVGRDFKAHAGVEWRRWPASRALRDRRAPLALGDGGAAAHTDHDPLVVRARLVSLGTSAGQALAGSASFAPATDRGGRAAGRDFPMTTRADAATLNVQPRQRRYVYMWLADASAGRSVKHLLDDLDIPEIELRETLRKLEAAGLARRTRATWNAIPLEDSVGAPDGA